MFKSMNEALSIPRLYEETQGEFWNDEHISAQMLKAHLDPANDGASRNHAFIERSADCIANKFSSKHYPQLLDIGCGPGIYAERFAKAGFQVTGVDFSQRSIDYAKYSAQQQGLDIDYVYQDYLSLDLDKQFDLATMIYCDYGALSDANRKVILHNVYMHLKSGGKFILDVFSLAAYKKFVEGQTWTAHSQGGFWSADSYIELQNRCKYTPNVTLEQYTIVSERESRAYYIWNSYFSRESLIAEVEAAGFKVCEVFGDVAGVEYGVDSLTVAIVVEK